MKDSTWALILVDVPLRPPALPPMFHKPAKHNPLPAISPVRSAVPQQTVPGREAEEDVAVEDGAPLAAAREEPQLVSLSLVFIT